MSEEKRYDWAQAMLALATEESDDLNHLAAAANLDPVGGDLADIDLSGIDLMEQDLSGWDLSAANLNRAKVSGTNLQNAIIDPWELVCAENWEDAILDTDLRELLGNFNRQLLQPVNDLELSVRTANCLHNARIKLVGDLVQMAESGVLQVPNFGRKSLNEIKEVLANMGLHLGMQLRGWRSSKYRTQRRAG
jgi:hypothetical protein